MDSRTEVNWRVAARLCKYVIHSFSSEYIAALVGSELLTFGLVKTFLATIPPMLWYVQCTDNL